MIELDTPTALIFMLCITMANSFMAFLLCKAQENIPGLWLVACGHLVTSMSLFFIGTGNIHLLTLHNVLALSAQSLIAEGIAAFFGRRPRPWVPLGIAGFSVAFWEIILTMAPDQIAVRVIVATLLMALPFVRAVIIIGRSRDVAPVAHNFLMTCISLHLLFLVGRCLLALLHPDQGFVISDPVRSLFFLEITVINTLIFYGILLIVGTHLSADLRRKAESLENERRLQGELRQLLHILGHELRTPLAVIGRSAEMIETVLTDPPPQVTGRLVTVRNTVARVDSLIDSLLTAERAGLGGGQHRHLDLTATVSDVVAAVAEQHGCGRLRLDCDKHPIVVLGDSDMLSTAIHNLLDNALKYSPADSTVDVSVTRRGDSAEVRVRDRGIGIPDHQLSRVGERFFRAENARVHQGSGLGLHIVGTIATRHGGHMDIRNAADGGTEVTLALGAG